MSFNFQASFPLIQPHYLSAPNSLTNTNTDVLAAGHPLYGLYTMTCMSIGGEHTCQRLFSRVSTGASVPSFPSPREWWNKFPLFSFPSLLLPSLLSFSLPAIPDPVPFPHSLPSLPQNSLLTCKSGVWGALRAPPRSPPNDLGAF